MNLEKIGRLALVAASLMMSVETTYAHGTHMEAPWDRDYSGTWELECVSAQYNAGAVFWINGVGLLPIPLGEMPGQCVPGVGVQPDPTWVQINVTDKVIELCQNIEDYVNQIGTLTGFTEACTEIADHVTAQFIATVRDASPQPWHAYYANWSSTYWHPWGSTYLFPNPLANDPHLDYVTLGGETGTTGNTVLGWAIDGIANGLTVTDPGDAFQVPVGGGESLYCTIGASEQLSHQVYTTDDTVTVTNNDVVATSCVTAGGSDNTFLGQFGVVSSGFVIAGDVLTVLNGVRVSKSNTLDEITP